MRILINRKLEVGEQNGIIKENKILWPIIYKALKSGFAKLIVDTEDTLMYEITN
jgi:hypothetical protein